MRSCSVIPTPLSRKTIRPTSPVRSVIISIRPWLTSKLSAVMASPNRIVRILDQFSYKYLFFAVEMAGKKLNETVEIEVHFAMFCSHSLHFHIRAISFHNRTSAPLNR